MPVSKDDILWAYRLLLGREAESQTVLKQHLLSPDRRTLVKTFIDSPEFIGSGLLSKAAPVTLLPLELPALRIDCNATDDQLDKMIEKIRLSWAYLGLTKPHFSVLSAREFLPENLAQSIGEFWASGEGDEHECLVG